MMKIFHKKEDKGVDERIRGGRRGRIKGVGVGWYEARNERGRGGVRGEGVAAEAFGQG